MLSYRDFIRIYKVLGIVAESRLLVHAAKLDDQEIVGGPETVVGALLASCETFITPTFTRRAMIIPPFGPPDNALHYGDSEQEEHIGEVFRSRLPSDPDMGRVAETIRTHPQAKRSTHPLLSFAGVHADEALSAQTLDDPWGPVRWLADEDGDILLFGDDHSENISLHYAEKLSGRKRFVRWAMVSGQVVEIPNWPGCSNGFQAIAPRLEGIARKDRLGDLAIQLIPLRDLINIATGWLREDPTALLCHDDGCEYCQTARRSSVVT
jgi:aminoglycoside 3-N-acetyltransferase